MRIRALSLAFALGLVAFASPAQPKMEVEKVAEGVWAARPEQGANIGWFLAADGVVVVDSGNDEATAKAVLEKIAETTGGKPVRYLVITHAHGDHATGAPVFAAAGARVICHENAATAVAYLLRGNRAPDSNSPAAGVIAISDRLTFFGGARRAAVYFLGAGHTNGDLVVLLPEEKILFSGDLVVLGRLPYLQSPDADPHGWEQILTRLAALEVDKIVPGHGAVGSKQGVSDTFAYVHKINQLATQFIQTQVPDDLYEMKLRDPENRITNVNVSPEHIANVRAAVKLERAKLAKAAETPTAPPAKRTPAPPKKPAPKKA
jgi:glyoxylase-like metal-dependent hydrolase (beta-lactamase superfamily II)